MAQAKPLASLSATLLARKGHARPAMRPQGFSGFAGVDDLGWNDMGQPSEVPQVVTQRAELQERIAAPAVAVTPMRAERIARQAAAKDGKCAFTLRLDAERHLRLRLATAVANRSAQALVSEALDTFLQTMPEVEELVRRLPPRLRR